MGKRLASFLLNFHWAWFHNSVFLRHERNVNVPRKPRQLNSSQLNEVILWSVCFQNRSVESDFQVCEDAVVLTLHSWKTYPTRGIPRVGVIKIQNRKFLLQSRILIPRFYGLFFSLLDSHFSGNGIKSRWRQNPSKNSRIQLENKKETRPSSPCFAKNYRFSTYKFCILYSSDAKKIGQTAKKEDKF